MIERTNKFQKKFDTLAAAVVEAKAFHENDDVSIIESNGTFFLEDADSTFVRLWEREWFNGKGKNARKPKVPA